MPPGFPRLLPYLYSLECPIALHSHTGVKRNEPVMYVKREERDGVDLQ